jgi:hypothetical protein
VITHIAKQSAIFACHDTNTTLSRTATMKTATSFAIIGALAAPYASAFPAAMMAAAARDPEIMKRTQEITAQFEKRQAGAGAATAVFEPVPIFNAKAQYVDVSAGSGHEFVAPSGDDLRGPCPGLNASKLHVLLMRSMERDVDRECSGQPQLPTARWMGNN